MAEDAETVEEGNDGNLANNAKPYNKVTRGDVIAGRLGKDEMGGKAKVKEEAEAVEEAAKPKRSAGTVFDAKVAAQYTKSKPGEKAGFSSKKISTGRVYSKNYEMEKPIKEGLTQTVINYNDFTLEVTDNPTYGDYLNALQSMINTTNEEYQQEMITIAEDAFNEKVESIIAEAKARATFKAKLDELNRQKGVKILDESYSVEDDTAYVEYTVEKDGVITQYVHVGTIEKK
jgi:hypothetical protein